MFNVINGVDWSIQGHVNDSEVRFVILQEGKGGGGGPKDRGDLRVYKLGSIVTYCFEKKRTKKTQTFIAICLCHLLLTIPAS